MKNSSLFLISIFLSAFCYSQAVPGVNWLKQFGGNGNDNIYRIIPTADTGWLVFGTSSSTTGDIGVNKGGTDIWITYWNRLGKIVWKKNIGYSNADDFADVLYNPDGTFYVLNKTLSPPYNSFHFFKMNLKGTLLSEARYGGAGDDIPIKIVRCAGGLLLIGNTTSYDLPSFHGGTDIYVVKVKDDGDSLRTLTKVWEKCLGGSAADEFFGAETDAAGNAILVSESASLNGDVTGLHGGTTDIWTISLNPNGVVNWQKCYGGSAAEFFGSVLKTPDNNIVIASWTSSADGDVTGLHGGADAWIIKIDAAGTILWKNCFGGTGNEVVYGAAQRNGGIFVTSITNSNNGNVSGNHGGDDIWVFKLNTDGNLLWQRSLGGGKAESYVATGQSRVTKRNPIITDKDGGCLVQGYSASVNGDVTGFHGTASSTVQDIWVVKISDAGTLEWQRCFGGTGREQAGDIVQNATADYTLGFSSLSGDGDFNGSFGNQDALLMRLGPSNRIQGSVYVDLNRNGVFDPSEILYPFDIKLQTTKPGDTTISTANKGHFFIEKDTGNYVTRVLPEFPYLVPTPASHNSSFASYFNSDTVNFGLQAVAGTNDLFVKIIPLQSARAGFGISFLVMYANTGTTPINNVQLKCALDPKLVFLNALPAQSAIVGDTLYLNLPAMPAFDGLKFFTVNCSIKRPPAANLGDSILFSSSIKFSGVDYSPENNSDTLKLRIVGSFDPNDKQEGHAGNLKQSAVQNGEFLNYFIRFQNTGTDTAFTVIVRDTLSPKFDHSSFQMLYSSHPYTATLQDNNDVEWTFSNINLPDSNVNEPLSHGIIAYRIKLKNTIAAGDTITNRASIYFDYNLPVATKNQYTIIDYPRPVITSFTPASGATGAAITVTGTDFTGATAVSFGGVAATSFTVNSATSITAIVGAGASGDVSVTTAGGTTALAGFTFIPAPAVTSFTPASAGSGAIVTITGTNFIGATAVSFGGVAATSFVVSSATTITAVIGAGASGAVSVTTPGGTATLAGFTFTVVTAIDPVSANSLGIRFYPNPTTGSFLIDTLKLSDKWETLEIFDTQGKKKLTSFTVKNKTRVNVGIEYLSNGLYMAILKRKTGPPAIIKFLKL